MIASGKGRREVDPGLESRKERTEPKASPQRSEKQD